MSYTIYDAVGNGAQTNPGLTAAQLAYLQSELVRAQQIRTNIRTDPRFSRAYEIISESIGSAISDWRKNYGYSPSDSGIYYDIDNLPYKKNGDILIVVHDKIRAYNADGSPKPEQYAVEGPYFDLRYNRIILSKDAIELIRSGNIEVLSSGGSYSVNSDWKKIELADVIMHEPGHRYDSASSDITRAIQGLWTNESYDHFAELLQQMGQIVDGRDASVPHGQALGAQPGVRYRDSSGEWRYVRTRVDSDLMWRLPSMLPPPERRVIKGLDGQFYVVNDLNGQTTRVSASGAVFPDGG